MAGVKGAVNEVVLVCLVDYLTGETLMNTHVRPSKKVTDWRTRVSGVTQDEMIEAIARGEALAGWIEARKEVWKYIDADTILVGHSLHNDLDVLRMVHTRVVDSAILARNAVGGNNRMWGLKILCEELLGIDVQTNGRNGHDCVEDTLATREVVLFCARKPEGLASWARVARDREEEKKKERKKEMQKMKAGKEGEERKKKTGRKEEQVKRRPEETQNPRLRPRASRTYTVEAKR